MRILLSWIGHTDIKSLFGGPYDEVVRGLVNPPYETPEFGGPIKTILSRQQFDAIYLLSNYSKEMTQEYISSLPIKPEVSYVTFKNPTDYCEIYKIENDFLESVVSRLGNQKYDLSILLSPGTPAMAAIWVLLGKTKYEASFWQTWKGVARKEEIPFDITLDVVPELLVKSDSFLSSLSARSPRDVEGFESIIGESKAIRMAVGRAQKAAIRDVSVLITGDSGTGKEMFATAIHKASSRRDKPFIAINCAAIPKELMESELFGHCKGAFTGAVESRDGAFKLADGGTLFLDEIGECPLQIQSKLLRILQPVDNKSSIREFMPVGATEPVKSDVRILAATNRDLISMIEENQFREDLYYRLAVITIKLPALKDRQADIVRIADYLLCQINDEFASKDKSYKHKYFSDSTKIFLKNYSWPGNARELYNVILQAAVMSDKEKITKEDVEASLPEIRNKKNCDVKMQTLGNGFCLENHIKYIRKLYLVKAMQESGGVKTKAAELLGMNSYQTLDAQIKKLDINLDEII